MLAPGATAKRRRIVSGDPRPGMIAKNVATTDHHRDGMMIDHHHDVTMIDRRHDVTMIDRRLDVTMIALSGVTTIALSGVTMIALSGVMIDAPHKMTGAVADLRRVTVTSDVTIVAMTGGTIAVTTGVMIAVANPLGVMIVVTTGVGVMTTGVLVNPVEGEMNLLVEDVMSRLVEVEDARNAIAQGARIVAPGVAVRTMMETGGELMTAARLEMTASRLEMTASRLEMSVELPVVVTKPKGMMAGRPSREAKSWPCAISFFSLHCNPFVCCF